jgi:hypothetical protein
VEGPDDEKFVGDSDDGFLVTRGGGGRVGKPVLAWRPAKAGGFGATISISVPLGQG